MNHVQGLLPFLVDDGFVGPSSFQLVKHLLVSLVGSQMKRGVPLVILHIEASPGRQEEFHSLKVTSWYCPVQSSGAVLVLFGNGAAVLEEDRDNGQPVLRCSVV